MKTIVLIALEASGDLLGAKLIHAFKKQGFTSLCGVAGPRMREAGIQTWKQMEEFQAIGPIEVLKKLPKIIELVRFLERECTENPPSVVVFLDSPSFSLKCAKRLKKKQIPTHTVQVVAPSVWAWGKEKRKQQIKESIDLLFPLFAFEESLFPIPTIWCGHPLFDTDFCSTNAPKSTRPLLALFPGSRPSEVKKNIDLMLQSAHHLQKNIPNLMVSICVAETVPEKLKKWIACECKKYCSQANIVDGSKRYDLMDQAWAALAKCGTVTLELFLKNVPSVVCYKVNFLERLWVKHILQVKTPYFALPNILSGMNAVKECIKDEPSPHELASYLEPLLQNQPKGVDEKALHLVQQQIHASDNPEEIIVQHIRNHFL